MTDGILWGGRFSAPPAEELVAFTGSLAFDRRLLGADLRATRAHVRALARAGRLSLDERDGLLTALADLEALAAARTFPFDEADEDVHTAVERVLTERLGDLGARVHAGRSRNDLVATDLRLWTAEAAGELADRARALAATLAVRAEEQAETLLPGYTHLQRAQPVTLGHHLLAHAFPMLRDAVRLDRAGAAAMARCPLGAGALAGSTLGIDPAATAADLGFAAPFDNSIDAVADRDFALELLAACASTAVHLSRLGEDLVLWTSQEFGFATPDDRYSTGSSMMPQKRNPDVAELARGKAGRVLGDLVALATVLKGLPLAYDRDLQEDKEAVFDAFDALAPALAAVRGMVATLAFDAARMRAAASGGFLLATDLAEALVAAGVPFREAHERIGELVARLETEGRALADVAPDEWASLDPGLGPETAALLDPGGAIARRGLPGGPSPDSVRRQATAVRAAAAPGRPPARD